MTRPVDDDADVVYAEVTTFDSDNEPISTYYIAGGNAESVAVGISEVAQSLLPPPSNEIH